MPEITTTLVEQAIAIIGAGPALDKTMEARVAELAQDPLLARRLINWPPEAFGLVTVCHMAKINVPTTFSARNQQGQWLSFELKAEPVFVIAVQIASGMFHSGPREVYRNIANRSAIIAAASTVLNAGKSIEGATFSGPALIGIPAEVYLGGSASEAAPAPGDKPRPLWRRLFSLQP